MGDHSFFSTIVPHSSEFMAQNIPCANQCFSFGILDIEGMRKSKDFPSSTEIRGFDFPLRPDFISPVQIDFPEYPFLLGMKYPFTELVAEFFSRTGIPYIQTMPVVWRILHWINLLNNSHGMGLGLGEVASVYDIRAFKSFWFSLKAKPGRIPLILESNLEDGLWKGRFFFVKRSTIPNGEELPMKWIKDGMIIYLCPLTVYSDP